MRTIDEPCPENNYLEEHAELIISSFLHLTGKHLVEKNLSNIDRYRALFEAPFCVVSHDTQTDPIFNYGNKIALKLFEIQWQDFIKLPSRKSAEPKIQKERDTLLAQVNQFGFIDNYKGVRVSSTGKKFFVEDSIVWNLIDKDGVYQGQAAVLYKWTEL